MLLPLVTREAAGTVAPALLSQRRPGVVQGWGGSTRGQGDSEGLPSLRTPRWQRGHVHLWCRQRAPRHWGVSWVLHLLSVTCSAAVGPWASVPCPSAGPPANLYTPDPLGYDEGLKWTCSLLAQVLFFLFYLLAVAALSHPGFLLFFFSFFFGMVRDL